MKKPIAYNPEKLLYKPIFTKDELAYLEALNSVSKSEYLLSPRNIQSFSISFAHTSAVLEGNTYSAVEAELLLTLGQTGAHRQLSEALMLKTMQSSFNYIVEESQHSKTDARRPLSYIVKNAHAMVSEGILNQQYCGTARNEPVLITATDYIPSDIPQQLEDGLQIIETEYDSIKNTFEKAVYIHQNLSYLQYFYDHNKRTARNMCAYTLLADNKMPVMFTERSTEEYARAVISYYESEPADYSAFKDYFIASYERVCSRMNAFAVEQAHALVFSTNQDINL
ncbi:Fic family protein [Moraxella nasovis]|uniref:Fic family protein n=1 Tax=Moraxella nasovis TaxID=2904121 RepID=UPI001F6012E8|nr:Fic family protein [Moraxella nasovis]UNU73374.1 Fic family protein [Moraxella nasovis]